MKEISSKKIRHNIRKIWPDCEFIWLADKKYCMPKQENIVNFLQHSDLDKQKFIDQKNDCDDFALQLHAEIKRLWQQYDCDYPIAFGECFANRWYGRKVKHNGNIAICENDIYLIEPQADLIFKADNINNNVLVVKM